MSNKTDSNIERDHDVKAILKGLAIAFVIGVIVVVTIVWPAEYGKDPTGMGAVLGLTVMSAEEQDAAKAAIADSSPTESQAAHVDLPVSTSGKVVPIKVPWPEQMEQAHVDNIGLRESVYRDDQIEVRLESGEGIEYKAVLLTGEPLLFSWKASGGEVYTDLHAEPGKKSDFPEKYWLRYDESETTAGHGYLIAPFDGNHGWYWLNRNIGPVTVQLEVSGFYSDFRKIE